MQINGSIGAVAFDLPGTRSPPPRWPTGVDQWVAARAVLLGALPVEDRSHLPWTG
ncbi:hypothetical protein ACWD1Y_31485 [Streptomyces sp. NPDC002814]